MEAFAFVVQLLTAISIIVSLVYLAVQIRDHTRARRREASREITRDLNDVGRYFIEYPDLSELYLKALGKPQELSVVERFRFERLITHQLSSFQMALESHKGGLLGDETIEVYSQGVLQLFESRAVIEWWEREGKFQFIDPKLQELLLAKKSAPDS